MSSPLRPAVGEVFHNAETDELVALSPMGVAEVEALTDEALASLMAGKHHVIEKRGVRMTIWLDREGELKWRTERIGK